MFLKRICFLVVADFVAKNIFIYINLIQAINSLSQCSQYTQFLTYFNLYFTLLFKFNTIIIHQFIIVAIFNYNFN